MLLSQARLFTHHHMKGKFPSRLLKPDLFHKPLSLQSVNLEIWVSSRGGPRLDERVCYYDINTTSSFGNLQPVRQYTEHEV